MVVLFLYLSILKILNETLFLHIFIETVYKTTAMIMGL